MPDDITPAGTSVPAATTAPAPAAPAPVAAPLAPPPAPAAAAPAAPASPVEADPAWLGDRLSRAKTNERAAVLKELGVDNLDAAKAAVSAAKAAEDAKKTEAQRAADLSVSLKTEAEKTSRLSSLVKEHAGRMMMALSQEQQKAVTDFAGDNPEEQLRAIQHFGPTWAKAAQAQAEAEAAKAAAAKPAPAAPPAQTAPAPMAPASAAPGSPPDSRSVYANARNVNPFAAAAYGLANPEVYTPKPG